MPPSKTPSNSDSATPTRPMVSEVRVASISRDQTSRPELVGPEQEQRVLGPAVGDAEQMPLSVGNRPRRL